MSVTVEFLDARIRGIGHIEGSLFISAESERAGKMPLRGSPPGLKKRSVGKKDVDIA